MNTRIFDDAKDKNVAAVVIYGDDGKAYVDADCEVQFKTSELKEAVLKRAVIMVSDAVYLPVSFAVSDEVGSVSYIVANGTTATSADLASLAALAD